MASYSKAEFSLKILDPLIPPMETLMTILELVEAVLEALLELLKAFSLDLVNPLQAIIDLLIAAIRAIIKQIESTGISLLLIHPNFNLPDASAIINSITGSYSDFERKVIGKFYDSSDLFRPQYPPGSSVAMLVFYIGAEAPVTLINQIFALLALIKQGVNVNMPAPIDLKVNPVNKGGQVTAQFRSLFDSGMKRALTLSWKMPMAASGRGVGGIVNSAVSFYNSFRFPNFIVERTGPFPQLDDSHMNPNGNVVNMEIETLTIGPQITDLVKKYELSIIKTKVPLREKDGSIFKLFPKKIDVGGYDLVEGYLTGSYEFTDSGLEPGKTYYYRVRSYFGNPVYYGFINNEESAKNSSAIRTNRNIRYLDFSPLLVLGKPSRVVAGFVPRDTSKMTFDIYYDMLDVVRVGLLLNFDLPPTYPPDLKIVDTETRRAQKTGWGTLSILAGQVGPIKYMYRTSDSIQDAFLFNNKVRRLVNIIITNIKDKPQILDLLERKWKDGVESIIRRFYKSRVYGSLHRTNEPVDTGNDKTTACIGSDPFLDLALDQFPEICNTGNNKTAACIGIIGSLSRSVYKSIDEYLALEDNYSAGDKSFKGPFPIKTNVGNPYVTVQERMDLADFIKIASSIGPQNSYLVWQSVTIGDLFPSLTNFLFDFFQFFRALLNAIMSLLESIKDIIRTLIQKIRMMKQILQMVIELLRLFNIGLAVSVLPVYGFGSADVLVEQFMNAENKPEDRPENYYSGLIMTCGGPGPGFVAAIKALAFIFSFGLIDDEFLEGD